MTAPNQPYPGDLDGTLGAGAYEIGGGDARYGQDIADDFVTGMFQFEGLPEGGAEFEIKNIAAALSRGMQKLPTEQLKQYQFLFPKEQFNESLDGINLITDSLTRFDDHPVEALVEFINGVLKFLGLPPMQLGELPVQIDELLSMLRAAFDKILTPFKSFDNLFSPEAWMTAWEGLLELCGLEYDPEHPNEIILDPGGLWERILEIVFPGAGEVLKDIIGLFNGLGTPFRSLDNLFSSEAWTTSWIAFLKLCGMEYDPANPNEIIADPGSIWNKLFQNVITPGSGNWVSDTFNWLNRLIEDSMILLDLLHLTYPVGDPSDPVNRKIGGKRTWYSAWNDLLDLTGLAHGSVMVSDVKAAIDDVEFTANAAGEVADNAMDAAGTASGIAATAQTTANQSKDWLGRLLEDLFILLDGLHLTYAPGKPSDAKDHIATTADVNAIDNIWHVGLGKRTWYAAWNDFMDVLGLSRTTAPATEAVAGAAAYVQSIQTTATGADTKANTAVSTASAADSKATTAQTVAGQANTKVGTLSNAVASGATGNTVTQSDDASVRASIEGMRDTLSAVQQNLGELAQDQKPSGVRFSDSGAGTGGVGVNWTTNGTASAVTRSNRGFHWNPSGTSTREMKAIWNAAVGVDDMQSRLVFFSLPVQTWFDTDKTHSSSNWLIVRASSNFSNYVYARIYQNQVVIGSVIGGTNTVRVTEATSSKSSSAWELRAVGNVFNVYQNNSLVTSWTDSANATAKGVNNRLVGFGLSTYANPGGENAPGDFTWAGQDLIPVTVKGTGVFVSRKGTVTKALTAGNSYNPIPYNFLDTTDVTSSDILADNTNQLGTNQLIVVVQNEGFYHVEFNIQVIQGDFFDGFYRIGSALTFGASGGLRTIQGSTHQTPSSHGGTYNTHFSGIVYLPAGGLVQPRILVTSGTWSLGGDSNGEGNWMSVVKAG